MSLTEKDEWLLPYCSRGERGEETSPPAAGMLERLHGTGSSTWKYLRHGQESLAERGELCGWLWVVLLQLALNETRAAAQSGAAKLALKLRCELRDGYTSPVPCLLQESLLEGCMSCPAPKSASRMGKVSGTSLGRVFREPGWDSHFLHSL